MRIKSQAHAQSHGLPYGGDNGDAVAQFVVGLGKGGVAERIELERPVAERQRDGGCSGELVWLPGPKVPGVGVGPDLIAQLPFQKSVDGDAERLIQDAP